ncbi:S-adenosyl-L-methionine-dependent methyltransferase [Westerdykella ornata]|uniref:S-adenosyl-L-methionine-dependent methyltransferase n=1 Tax=Westerdykella ornata TaxID=318751 RepID=A0A6A6JXY9_WESOR|nr:S-adenosyl-L-methionine-dependent methyltransferase [Westerdykella ornata]KAF2281277.1 S-adenosyl-L-methionine-dependent methyltransferase [Westerdykella ornata]
MKIDPSPSPCTALGCAPCAAVPSRAHGAIRRRILRSSASSRRSPTAIPPRRLHFFSRDGKIQLVEARIAVADMLPADNVSQPAGDPPHDDEPQHVQDDAVSDSGFDSGSLLGDDTDTLASSIMHYRMENGRQYHAYRDGAYWGPNDEMAKEILDFAHHMYLLTLDRKLHLAPIKNPQMILDVGTGTGIWAIDMADQYPEANVIGTDLSPIQPEWVPPNCRFEIDDVTLDWTFPENYFDFIHIRELFGCVPDWDVFFEQAYTHTKPGGWVEIVEHSVHPISDDGTMGPDHFYNLWGRTVIELGEKWGKGFTIWEESEERMLKAGFVDVVRVDYKWPMNGWPEDKKLKNIGRWNQLRLHEGIEGFMIRLLTQVGGWSVARAQVFLAEMRKELKNYKTHAYLPVTVVYGRKPLGP